MGPSMLHQLYQVICLEYCALFSVARGVWILFPEALPYMSHVHLAWVHITTEQFPPPGLVHHRPTSMLQWRCASHSVGSCPGANLLGPWLPDVEWVLCSQFTQIPRSGTTAFSWFYLFRECKIVFPYFCPSRGNASQFRWRGICWDIHHAWSSPARLCHTCKWRQQLLISNQSVPLSHQANLPTQPKSCQETAPADPWPKSRGKWLVFGTHSAWSNLQIFLDRHHCRDVGLTSK